VGLGYQRVKIKIQPGWDAEPIERIREEFPELMLGADANGAYGPDDVHALQPLDRFDLSFLEQPLRPDLLVAHRVLQSSLKTVICLDETLRSADLVAEAIGLRACGMVNIKIGRIGGPSAARDARDLCREHGVACWVGGMLESGIGRLHNVALAATAGFTHPGDISASKRYVEEDVIDPPVEVAPDGTVAVPTAPGLGATVREDVLERYTVRSQRIG
jgi:O-succinylbenzoate synthase